MATSNEYRMAIKIAGEIEQSLYNCTDLTRKELNKIAREAASASTQTKSSFSKGLKDSEPFFEGLEKVGTKAFKALAAAAATTATAVIAIGTASAQAGIEFESAFAGVKKTTEATEEEYEQLREEIIAMTREIPATAAEISEVAEAAGQLGIEKENLLEFSRVMIDLGESTNLTSTEAASDLAKFANITNMAKDKYNNLGSVIVDLGNNFATTESDIVTMGTRLASAGELAGFTEAEIMAMATAMSSVGIEAEAGGSSMSKIIKKVQVAVETGSSSLKNYASVAGKTVDEFKEEFQENALSAVAAFISGLNDVERNGKSATVILDEMGLTQVNVSNALLSLANAGDLLERAVTTANSAWEENTALTKEAAQRYETTESKISIMKNGFTEMGIAIYDQFNEPLREGIDVITELTYEATKKISGSNVIHDLAQDIISGAPTAIRVIEQTTEAVGNFAEPFLEIGGWLVKNPKVLTSTIAGVGTALATYKIVNSVTSLTTAFKALRPEAWAVMGAAGGISALVGVGTYFAQLDEELTKANLEEHFGDIALSIDEINEAARQIVGSSYLDQMDDLLSVEATSNNLISSIEDTMRDINEQRWELSVGLAFSQDDLQEYAQSAQQYIEEVQSYISNEGYAFQLSTELLLDGSVNMEDIIVDNNNFYSQLGSQMQEIGDEVSSIINQALEEGLEIDQEEIDNLLSQVQEIQEAFTSGKMAARLETLEARYSGAELTEESFQNLMQEINDITVESNEDIWEEYNDIIANLNTRLKLDDSYTQEQYEADKAEYAQAAHEKELESALNSLNFLTNTMEDTYGEEIDTEAVREYMQNTMNELMGAGSGNKYATGQQWYDMTESIVTNVVAQAGNDYAEKAAASLMEYGDPIMEQIDMIKQQAEIYGGLSEEMQSMVDSAENNYNAWKAATGDEESIYQMLGDVVGENEEYSVVIMAARQSAGGFTQEFIDTIKEKQPEAEETAKEYLEASKQALENGYDATIPINVSYKYVSEYLSGSTANITTHGDGGIVTSPTVSWLAEAGYPESVIPLDGSQNAVGLWERTGEMLGVFKKDGFSALAAQLMDDYTGNGSSITNSAEDNRFSYSPTYYFYGDAPSKEDLNEHVEESFEKWEEMMNRWIRNNKRYSFS